MNENETKDESLQAAIELSYQQYQATTAAKPKKTCKRRVHRKCAKEDEEEIVKASRMEADHSRFYHEKVEVFKVLSTYISYIHYFAIYLEVECILSHYWFKKILKKNLKENIVFIHCIDKWKELSSRDVESALLSKSYDALAFKKLLRNDPIISQCDNELLVYGYLRNNDNQIYIPSDIVRIITLLCGVISSLLPSITNDNKYFDFGQYHVSKNEKLLCYTHVYDVCKFLKINTMRLIDVQEN